MDVNEKCYTRQRRRQMIADKDHVDSDSCLHDPLACTLPLSSARDAPWHSCFCCLHGIESIELGLSNRVISDYAVCQRNDSFAWYGPQHEYDFIDQEVHRRGKING